jgi:predicted ATP-binding protein involved in virulence
MTTSEPKAIIIAGPNGSGKTTGRYLIIRALALYYLTKVPVMIQHDNSKRDPDFVGAEEAIKRAALRAREVAFRTGTPLVICKDGVTVKKQVTQEELEPKS